MKALLTIVFATSIAFSGAVPAASTPIEATKTCLSDNTSGKDRKLLAKWIFLAMAAHPEFKGFPLPLRKTRKTLHAHSQGWLRDS